MIFLQVYKQIAAIAHWLLSDGGGGEVTSLGVYGGEGLLKLIVTKMAKEKCNEVPYLSVSLLLSMACTLLY